MKVAIALAIMICCTVAANLLLKLGATAPAAQPSILGILPWQTLAGLFVFSCSLLIYSWVLTQIPLNLAQSFAAAQFIGVILASAIVLYEPISPVRWLGIALIATGILIVGATAAWR